MQRGRLITVELDARVYNNYGYSASNDILQAMDDNPSENLVRNSNEYPILLNVRQGIEHAGPYPMSIAQAAITTCEMLGLEQTPRLLGNGEEKLYSNEEFEELGLFNINPKQNLFRERTLPVREVKVINKHLAENEEKWALTKDEVPIPQTPSL